MSSHFQSSNLAIATLLLYLAPSTLYHSFFPSSLAQAQTTQNQQSELKQLLPIGIRQLEEGQFQEAFKTFRKVVSLQRKQGDQLAQGITLGTMGEIFLNLEKYPHSLETYKQSLRIFQQLGKDHDQAIILNNIGVVYKIQGQYDLALDYYQQALTLQLELDNRKDAATNLNNIGEIYRIQGQYPQALDHYQNAGLSPLWLLQWKLIRFLVIDGDAIAN
ncbi:MAG: tetratricopeptide repeat protein [Symploca sp. SIO1B1]|nr:tetratricopeptide repeat protein [Symploca sp. SIO1B1]